MSAVIDERQQFLDDAGRPVVNGYLYFGVVGSDPQSTPIAIFADRKLTVRIENPQRTDASGRSLSKVWIEGRYSFKLQSSNHVQLYQELDNGSSTSTDSPIVLSGVQGFNAISATATPAITSYTDKQIYVFTVALNNTGPVTLDINNLGPIPVELDPATPIQDGDFLQSEIVLVSFNKKLGVFQWINQKIRPLVGEVSMFAGATAPSGWLFCDGGKISRKDFNYLFSVIGTNYGEGDGSTTFGLPDFRSRSPMGAGKGTTLSQRNIGDKTGEEKHLLSMSEMPEHTHELDTGQTFSGGRATVLDVRTLADTVTTTSAYTHDAGGTDAHNTVHPSLVVNFIIKT